MGMLASVTGLETVGAQAPSALDRQGKPSYGASTDISARVVREEKVARAADGSEIVSVATIWIDAGQAVLPIEEWRLTLAEGLVLIVVERYEGRALNGVLDHIRLRMRRE